MVQLVSGEVFAHSKKHVPIDPEKYYQTPQDILADPGLTDRKKQQTLRQWAEDQKALLRASAENMAPVNGNADAVPARMLQDIRLAEHMLAERIAFTEKTTGTDRFFKRR